ncbi:hypothetical protein ACX9NE_03545 [Mycobacterium sp. ML4]
MAAYRSAGFLAIHGDEPGVAIEEVLPAARAMPKSSRWVKAGSAMG